MLELMQYVDPSRGEDATAFDLTFHGGIGHGPPGRGGVQHRLYGDVGVLEVAQHECGVIGGDDDGLVGRVAERDDAAVPFECYGGVVDVGDGYDFGGACDGSGDLGPAAGGGSAGDVLGLNGAVCGRAEFCAEQDGCL